MEFSFKGEIRKFKTFTKILRGRYITNFRQKRIFQQIPSVNHKRK